MPKKKSIRRAADQFKKRADAIGTFLTAVPGGQSDEHVSWLYDYGIIRLYRDFETLMLHALIGAINNDTNTLSSKTGVQFPGHLTDEICAYIIVGSGYFDFKGRDGLIGEIKRYVPNTHYLVDIVKKQKYKDALERLAALRNYAAHASGASKRAARAAVRQQRIGSAGSWLKSQGRFDGLKDRLKELADDIYAAAPY